MQAVEQPQLNCSMLNCATQNYIEDKNLFDRLDSLVDEAGGRLYPAKDAHMSKEHFKRAYPDWIALEKIRDPKLLSKFWKRVTHD